MKSAMVTILAAMLSFSSGGARASHPAAGPNLLELFVLGDFVPHVPTIADVKAQFGAAQGALLGERAVYTYRVATNGWVTFHPHEMARDSHSWIEEVTYSIFPPTTADSELSIDKVLTSDKLMGIGLGDSVKKLEARRVSFRKTEVKLFGRDVVAYECTPFPGQTDLFYRYFIANDRVAAFSMGVTE